MDNAKAVEMFTTLAFLVELIIRVVDDTFLGFMLGSEKRKKMSSPILNQIDFFVVIMSLVALGISSPHFEYFKVNSMRAIGLEVTFYHTRCSVSSESFDQRRSSTRSNLCASSISHSVSHSLPSAMWPLSSS